MRIKKLIEHLRRYDKDTECAYVLWLPIDVEDMAFDLHVKLTDQEVNEVLQEMNRHSDANIGMTWDSVRDGIHSVKAAKTKGE